MAAGLPLLMVALGIATNQVLNNRVWSWPWFALAIASAVTTVAVDRRMAAAEQPRARLRPSLVDVKDHPLRVSEVTPPPARSSPVAVRPSGRFPVR